MWGNQSPYTLLVTISSGVTTVEKRYQFLKKLILELAYNPEILILGIGPKESKAETKAVFMTALFTITKM